MASQLVIITGTHPSYEDGDILHAFSALEVRRKWAELLCRQAAPETLLEPYFQKTRQYKHQVVAGQIWRTDQRTLEEVECTWVADADRFVSLYARPVFRGDTFYGCGGKTYFDKATVDDVWAYIEANTAYREADYPNYPWNNLRKYLVVTTADFDDAAAVSYEQPQMSGETVVKKRRRYVDWRSGLTTLGATEADVLDRGKPVDVRAVQLNGSIVQAKA